MIPPDSDDFTVFIDTCVLVTFNKKHFPRAVLEPLEIEVIVPDVLLESVFDLHPEQCNAAIERYLKGNRRPPQHFHEFQAALVNFHLMKAVEKTKRWANHGA